MVEVAEIMSLTLQEKHSVEELRKQVENLCNRYPLYN